MKLLKTIFLFCLFQLKIVVFSQNINNNNALNSILTITDNTQKVDSLEKFVKSIIFTDPATAEVGSKKLLALSKDINSKKQTLTAYNLIGLSLYYIGKSEEGVKYLDTLLLLSKKQNDSLMLSKAYSNLGMLHERLGNFDKAYENNLNALKIAESNNNKTSMANSMGNLGNVCIRLKKFDEAILFLEKSAQLNLSLGNKKALANQYNSLAVIFSNLNDSKNQNDYLKKSKKLYQEIGDDNGLATVLINIADYEAVKKNYKKAIILCLEVVTLKKKVSDKTGEANALVNIAGYYANIGDFENAHNSLSIAEKNFSEIKDLFGLTSIKKTAALISQLEGNFEKATQELKEYNTLKDSAIGEKKQLAVLELQQKYEVEKKDLQLKLQNATIKEEQTNSFNTKLIFIITLILMLLIVLVFYLNFKHKQKIKSAIEKINSDNLLKQAELEAKEKERNRLASELHDNVGSSVSYMSIKIDWLLNHHQLNQESKAEIVQLKNTTQDVISGLRETLWTLNTKNISNLDLCDKLKVYFKKHLLCTLKIDDQLTKEFQLPNEDVLALYRCSQEIINNINKHSKAKNATIQFISNLTNELKIVFIDDGIGFNFIEKDESYGLRNIKARMEKINAKLIINSKINVGTEIILIYTKFSA